MRKLCIALLAAAFVVTGVFATPVTETTPTLTVSVPWAGEELEQFRPVVRAFEARENVTVRYLTYRAEDLASVLPAQFQARQTLADVIFMWDWWIRENPQHAVDLRDVWNRHEQNIVPPAITAGGKVAGVPYTMVAKPGFWYRQSFFERHGLSEPTTWNEFTALLERIGRIPGIRNPIATGNGVGWPISDITEHFLVAYGGAQLQLDLISGEATWQSSRVRQIFENRLVPLLSAGAFSDPIEWTQAVELWWDGDYALYFMGNWITGMVADASDLGVFPLPEARAIVTGPDTFFIPQYSEQQDLARRFADFLLSAEGQRIRARSGGKLIIRNDIPASTYPAPDQAVAAVVAGMETTVPDLDDSIGGDWQPTFWDQLKLLWVQPDQLGDVLRRLDAAR